MLELKNITKNYGEFRAVDHLNLKIKDGSIFGFLGHNGAGKTTTLSMLSTLILPTEGSAEIDGLDIVRDNLEVRKLIGYLPENVMLYGDLSATENLRFFGKLSGVSKVDIRIIEILDMLGLLEWKDVKVGTFSKGMRQRIGIAQALLHQPKVLLLDEPSSGLDPKGTRDMRDILKLINKEMGTTIFMNTHLLSEVTKICTDIGIISKGKILFSGSLEKLERDYGRAKSLEEIYFDIEGGYSDETSLNFIQA